MPTIRSRTRPLANRISDPAGQRGRKSASGSTPGGTRTSRVNRRTSSTSVMFGRSLNNRRSRRSPHLAAGQGGGVQD